MNQSVERSFAFVDERGLIGKLSADARSQIEHGLLPLRHLHWGANMNMTEICQRGYGSGVTAPCIFSAGDHLGMAQIVSRIGLMLDGQTGVSLDMAKETWLNNPAWQGVRKLIEDTFVERDWFQLFVAQTLAVNGVVFDLIYKHADAAWKEARRHRRHADRIHDRLARRGKPLERFRDQDRRGRKRRKQGADFAMGEALDRPRGRGRQAPGRVAARRQRRRRRKPRARRRASARLRSAWRFKTTDGGTSQWRKSHRSPFTTMTTPGRSSRPFSPTIPACAC